MTQTWRTVTVGQDDTIEALAARYLGTAARWRAIAGLNNLRAPFISAKPADWFGPMQSTGLLAYDVATGDAETSIVGESPDFLPQGGVYFVDGYDIAGQYLYEAIPIREYDPGTGILSLYEAFRYAWHVGTRWSCYLPQRDLGDRVARPGEVLMLPIPFGEIGATLLTDDDFAVLYGTDIELARSPIGGVLVWESGDLAVVRGRDNIAQALRFRADLPFGTDIFAPEEGNRAHELIGLPIVPGTLMRARNYTRAALGTDPRVVEVPDVTAGSRDDVMLVDANVILANNPDAVRVTALILRS